MIGKVDASKQYRIIKEDDPNIGKVGFVTKYNRGWYRLDIDDTKSYHYGSDFIENDKDDEKIDDVDDIMIDTENVYLKCVREGSRLRIKIISLGYDSNANCRFPRDIRKEGLIYSVPVEDVKCSRTNVEFFYMIKKANIKII